MKKTKFLTKTTLALSILMCCSTKVNAESINSIKKSDTLKTVETSRIKGKNRYLTSVEVCKKAWKDGSENIIIVNGEDFPDALCAVPLSKKYDAPILLVSKEDIEKETLEEIKRLGCRKVLIMGKEGSVSKKVEKSIKNLKPTISIERIGGNNRYETSIKVAEKFNTKKVVLASGENYPDSLSIAAIAAQKGIPIVLTEQNGLPSIVQEYIKFNDINESIIVGGWSAISGEIDKKFNKSERIKGNNRYETNFNVINRFKEELKFENLFFAVGGPDKGDFADALSGAAFAAKESSFVILVDKNQNEIKNQLITENLTKNIDKLQIITLGGEGLIKNNFVEKIKSLIEEKWDKSNNEGEGENPNNDENNNDENSNGENGTVGSEEDNIVKNVNSASKANIKKVIIDNAKALSLDLNKYYSINEGRQQVVANDLYDNKPEGGYKSAEDINKVFNELLNTRVVIERELEKVNIACENKSIEGIKDLKFLTNVLDEIKKSSYEKLSGYVLSIWETSIAPEHNRLIKDKEKKLNKLIQNKYESYSQMLERLSDLND